MATVTRVRRVANPRRKNARRRKMTPKQIKHFGTKRQKAALKAKRRAVALKGKHKPARKANRARKTKKAANRKRSLNPALVLTLGAINPRKRSKSVAKKHRKSTKKRANPRRTKKRSRKNPTRVVVYKTKAVKHRRRRNPIELFGQKSTGGLTKVIAGGLVGVAAAKFLPTLLPANFVSSNITRTVATAVAAYAAGLIASKVTDKNIGDAVMFGGFMQTASVALNAFLPSIGRQVGLGELMPGRFPVPQNPLMIPAPVAAPNARIGVSGLNRSFGAAF